MLGRWLRRVLVGLAALALAAVGLVYGISEWMLRRVYDVPPQPIPTVSS